MWGGLELDLQDLSQIYILLSVNSFIVFMDQLIELSKSKEFEKSNLEDIELNEKEMKQISTVGISLLVLITELIILIYLKSILSFCIILLINSTNHHFFLSLRK